MKIDESNLVFPDDDISEANQKGQNPHAIERISIEGLFGQFDYELSAKNKGDVDRLFIMYGENGAGKTTLLKMIYHALSSEDGGGHRSFLAKTRFDRFSIHFNDGMVLESDRRMKKSGGSLLMTLRNRTKIIAGVEAKIESDMNVRIADGTSEKDRYMELLNAIRRLKIKVHYLSDDRKHQGDVKDLQRGKVRQWIDAEGVQRIVPIAISHSTEEELWALKQHSEGGNALELVMSRVVMWVQHQVRRGATRGQGSVYEIYSKVIGDIAHSDQIKWNTASAEKQSVISTLQQLEATSMLYSEYGLAPPFPVQPIIDNIQGAGDDRLPIVYSVIKPHMEGINARLTALSFIYNTISRLVDTLNEFYRNKRVSFHVDKGFSIQTGKEVLNPSLLSSGEKQLFLLLCNTILARTQASLFLIDEPELSLNVEWQRQLVQAVLDNTSGSNVQFIMSTHSMELITQHSASVVRLAPVKRKLKSAEANDVNGKSA